jgi:predicted TIM-barrel fold metal-dependent hydrolase
VNLEFRYGDYSAICRPYLPDDYRRDTANHDVVATVHVEAEWDREGEVAETRWLHDLRAEHGLPTVVVGHARLERDDVEAVLAEHARYPAVRGIRQKPMAGSMSDPRWQLGYALLEKYKLSFDLQTPWWHLAEAAAAVPGIQIVVNHTGLPADRNEPALAAWRRALETVAAEPNVAIKISGLGARNQTWPAASNHRVIRETIEVFGVDRCLFASNFPVDSLCADYDTIVATFTSAIAELPLPAQRALLHDNAARIYRVEQ